MPSFVRDVQYCTRSHNFYLVLTKDVSFQKHERVDTVYHYPKVREPGR